MIPVILLSTLRPHNDWKYSCFITASPLPWTVPFPPRSLCRCCCSEPLVVDFMQTWVCFTSIFKVNWYSTTRVTKSVTKLLYESQRKTDNIQKWGKSHTENPPTANSTVWTPTFTKRPGFIFLSLACVWMKKGFNNSLYSVNKEIKCVVDTRMIGHQNGSQTDRYYYYYYSALGVLFIFHTSSLFYD